MSAADPLDSLAGETEVVVQCGVASDDTFDEDDPEFCEHEPETVELDEPAWRDEWGKIHLPGRPQECPECGNPNDFRVNGVRVIFS